MPVDRHHLTALHDGARSVARRARLRSGLYFLFVLIAWITGSASCFAAYEVAAANAVSWLLVRQNAADGSWGETAEVKYVQTSEAVLALAALNRRTPQYYAGLGWLQNNVPDNTDYLARRVLALQSNGSSVSADLATLQAAQRVAEPGNKGWGLSAAYQGAALDTALVLQACNQAGGSVDVAGAVGYLIGAQLTGGDKGWVIGQETSSDPVTTAQALIALIPLKATYPALPASINHGFAALNGKVTVSSSAPQQALAVIANLRNGNEAAATPLLSSLVGKQSGDGSWSGDIHATALALRAMAAGMARDLAAQQEGVSVPDAELRAAINEALGRNALDTLNKGELAQLTSLDISARGISDLSGLQHAVNLTHLDARNNTIVDFDPVAGLAANILKDGNPGYVPQQPVADGDVPLPGWAVVLLATFLMGGVMKNERFRR